MSGHDRGHGGVRRRSVIVSTLGITQTLAWGSTYYLPAVFADRIAGDLHISREWFFAVFSGSLLALRAARPCWPDGPLISTAAGMCWRQRIWSLPLGWCCCPSPPACSSLGLAWTVIGIGMGFGLYEAAFATVTGLWGKDARNAITGITLFAGFASTVGWPLSSAVHRCVRLAREPALPGLRCIC